MKLQVAATVRTGFGGYHVLPGVIPERIVVLGDLALFNPQLNIYGVADIVDTRTISAPAQEHPEKNQDDDSPHSLFPFKFGCYPGPDNHPLPHQVPVPYFKVEMSTFNQ
ncbi:MAG TPA: hypothetical protein VMT94_01240 [Burkholderiales bacterium]|nr:hypothetical protein [Burkholderiales bacterium]